MIKDLRKFYIITFIFEIARTMPHAFLILYLLKSNISIFQISIMQIFYMLAIILFEIPSGVLADKFSKKKLYFFSCGLMVVSCALYINIYSAYTVFIAHFFYGVSSALETGTIDSLVINAIHDKSGNNDSKELEMNIFFRNTEIITTTGMILGSSLGSYLYFSHIGSKVYLVSITLIIIAAIVSLTMSETKKKTNEKNNISKFLEECFEHFSQGIKNIISNKKLILLMTVLVVFQFVLQPFFNYWQPISVLKNISEAYMGYIYISMQIFVILSTYVHKHITERNRNINLPKLGGIMVLLLAISLLSENKFIYLIFLILSTMPRTILLIKYNAKIQNEINNEHRSTITSAFSLYTRIFSIITLGVMAMLNKLSFNVISIFAICMVLYLVSYFLIQYVYRRII